MTGDNELVLHKTLEVLDVSPHYTEVHHFELKKNFLLMCHLINSPFMVEQQHEAGAEFEC